MKFEKPPTIYIGKRLVMDYEQLPYENIVIFMNEDFGRICLSFTSISFRRLYALNV